MFPVAFDKLRLSGRSKWGMNRPSLVLSLSKHTRNVWSRA